MARWILLGSLLGLGACGGSGDANKVTIWWAEWAPATGLQELGKEFEKETGIAVQVHQIPWSSYQSQVFMEFGAKAPRFDIVVGDSQWLGQGATQKLYVDLTDWLKTAVDPKTLHPVALKYLCEYPTGSGRYWAAPCETDAMGVMYRKDWFEDAKEKKDFKERFKRDLAVPQTWEEFRDVSEFFTRPERKMFGCALMTGRSYDEATMQFQAFLWSFGAQWGDPATFKVKGHLNGPPAVDALSFFTGLTRFSPPGGTSLTFPAVIDAFTGGSVAMAINYFAFYPRVVREMGPKAGFAMVPGKGGNRVIPLGGQGFSIAAKAPPEKQELAKKFIAWFLKTDVQKKWIQKDAGFTANTEILKSEAFRKATPYNAAFADSMDHLRDFWNVPVYSHLLEAAQKYLGEALDGVKSPKEALDTMAEKHEEVFRKAGMSGQ
jgi:multiple sugar transport system substrate-binding protein